LKVAVYKLKMKKIKKKKKNPKLFLLNKTNEARDILFLSILLEELIPL
jgi:hypothetical protein